MTSKQPQRKTKKELIREYLSEHPDASNQEVVIALRRQGHDIPKKTVSATRSILGLTKPRPKGGSRSILRAPNELKAHILLEVHRRGGRVEIGESRKPGKDRDIYVRVAEAIGVSPEEQMLTVGEICPDILATRRQNAEAESRRNAWDRTMLVAVQQLKDHRFGGPFIQSPDRGVWELTQLGIHKAERMLQVES